MTIARIYIDGDALEIIGNVTDKFLKYSNELMASRGGRIYASTESKVPTVTVENLMFDNDEYPPFEQFLNSCSSRRFNCTVEFLNDGCGDAVSAAIAGLEYNYIDCIIQGEPEYSFAERKISGFEFGYSRLVTR